MKVFIMDTWAYPYRLPIFERLHEQVEIEAFFSRPKPFDHLDDISLADYRFTCRSGNWLFALAPVHLLWKKYDVYMVGQIGVESVVGAFFTLLVSKLRKKPLVLWTDYIETEYYRKLKKIKKFFGDLIRRTFLSSCSAAIGFGSYTEQYLKKMGRAGLPIFNIRQVVPEVCNYDLKNGAEKSGYADKTVVLCVSYLRAGKGLDFLIRTFREMGRTDVILMIAGIGADEQRLRALAGNSEYIQFVGYVEGKEKAKRYSQADIFVFPTEHDTWGLAVNEAMHYGLPIVITDAAGASELVTDNGIVIESGNGDMLKQALIRLIEDSDLRKKMGERSQAYIGRYGIEYAVDSFMQVIRWVSDKSAH